MTDEPKLTQDELGKMFGDTIPIEAVNLIFVEAPDTMTMGQMREKLRAMATPHKRHAAATKAITERLREHYTDPRLDWPWIFSDAARLALAAADAVADK